MPLTAEPAVLPVALLLDARAEALAVIEPTVTSPPKSERPETVTVAPASPPCAETVEETDAACATEPSAGNANGAAPLLRFGGPDRAAAVEPPCPGTETWMPNASALDVPARTAEDTPLDPVNARTKAALEMMIARLTTPRHYSQSSGGSLGSRFRVAREDRAATIHGDRCAVDEARLVREQMRNNCRDLLRVANPTQRMDEPHLLLDARGAVRPMLGQELCVALGGDRPQRDRVDPDPSRPVIHGKRPGQSLDRSFGRRVRQRTRHRPLRLVRRDVDDGAARARRQKPADRNRTPDHDRVQVQTNQVEHLARGRRVNRSVPEDRGVVDPAGERRDSLGSIGRLLRDGLVGRVSHYPDHAGAGRMARRPLQR